MPDQLFFDIVKMVLALTCILGLIFGVVYLLKRFLPGATRAASERVDMYVVSQLPIGSRQRIAVVRVHDRTLVLGISEASITTLAELTPKRADGQDQKEADDPKIFADLLVPHKSGPANGAGRADDALLPPDITNRREQPRMFESAAAEPAERSDHAGRSGRSGSPRLDPAAVRDLFDSLSGPSK